MTRSQGSARLLPLSCTGQSPWLWRRTGAFVDPPSILFVSPRAPYCYLPAGHSAQRETTSNRLQPISFGWLHQHQQENTDIISFTEAIPHGKRQRCVHSALCYFSCHVPLHPHLPHSPWIRSHHPSPTPHTPASNRVRYSFLRLIALRDKSPSVLVQINGVAGHLTREISTTPWPYSSGTLWAVEDKASATRLGHVFPPFLTLTCRRLCRV